MTLGLLRAAAEHEAEEAEGEDHQRGVALRTLVAALILAALVGRWLLRGLSASLRGLCASLRGLSAALRGLARLRWLRGLAALRCLAALWWRWGLLTTLRGLAARWWRWGLLATLWLRDRVGAARGWLLAALRGLGAASR